MRLGDDFGDAVGDHGKSPRWPTQIPPLGAGGAGAAAASASTALSVELASAPLDVVLLSSPPSPL